MKRSLSSRLTCLGAALIMLATPVFSFDPPEHKTSLADAIYDAPNLYIRHTPESVDGLSALDAVAVAPRLQSLGIRTDRAKLDRRGGTWLSLIQARPMVPGNGVGNDLTWEQFGLAGGSDADYEAAVRTAFNDYLNAYAADLGIDTAELGHANVAVKEGGRVTHVYVPREVDGVHVHESFISAGLNSGNLVLYGTYNWGPMNATTTPSIDEAAARGALESHVAPHQPIAYVNSRLLLVPASAGPLGSIEIGAGYDYKLVWELNPSFERELGKPHWQAWVDAHSGDVMRFHDTNQYITRDLVGAVLPVSNDGTPPDGIEFAGLPMPFATMIIDGTTTSVTNSNGLLVDVLGVAETDLTGPFVRMNDNCGFISESTAGVCDDLDLGASATANGTDCTTPVGSASPGNTRSSRSGFFEVNRIIENAKVFRPNNQWLQQQLTSNMNINNSCNAFWGGGTINFYRDQTGVPDAGDGTCRNTGEIAAVFDHEWGHGMDNNDNIALVSAPGEAYADIAAIFRLDTSCIGRGFRKDANCTGFGDACTDCTGVREDDWKKHFTGNPHGITWVLQPNAVSPPGGCAGTTGVGTPCNSATHCEGTIIGEAFFDLYKRDMPCHGNGWVDGGSGTVWGGECTGGAAPTIDNNTSLEMLTRLFYIAGDGVHQGFSCTALQGGCSAVSYYNNMLLADDDNGDINDGTPHMQAIYDAFNRHEIQCDAPLPADTGCAIRPTTAPAVTVNAGPQSATVSWGAVADAAKYWVFRTEGVFACDFGKIRVAEIDAADPLTFTDTGLLDGLEYYYIVVPVGPTDSCIGPSSSCNPVTPLADSVVGVGGSVFADAAMPLSISTGDGDQFLDNCEATTINVDVLNIGTLPLTNVQVTGVSVVSPPGVALNASGLPAAVTPGTLAAGCGVPDQSGDASFDIAPSGLTPGDILTLEVTAVSTEIPGGFTGLVQITDTEQDLVPVATTTFSFESDNEGWTNPSGSFGRDNLTASGTGGPGTYTMKSSSAVDATCDVLRSPEMRLTSTSTLSLFNAFSTEPEGTGGGISTFYDRGNVYIIDANTKARIGLVEPDGGRTYNAVTAGGTTYSACNDDLGWASGIAYPDGTSYGEATWSAAALNSAGLAGQPIQFDVISATDSTASAEGFRYDDITVTDILGQGDDVGSDVCASPPTCTIASALFGDAFETGDATAWSLVRNPQGDMSFSDLGLEGLFGMEIAIDHSSSRTQRQHYVAKTHAASDTYCWSFLFDPNSINVPSGRFVRIWGARGDNNRRLLDMAIRNIGGTYHVALQTYKDGGATASVPFFPIADAPMILGGEWSNTAAGGVLKMYVDGVETPGSLSGVTNISRELTTPGMGNLGQIRRGTLGSMYFDDFRGGAVAP